MPHILPRDVALHSSHKHQSAVIVLRVECVYMCVCASVIVTSQGAIHIHQLINTHRVKEFYVKVMSSEFFELRQECVQCILMHFKINAILKALQCHSTVATMSTMVHQMDLSHVPIW